MQRDPLLEQFLITVAEEHLSEQKTVELQL